MMIKKEIYSDLAIPPGEFLEEVIEELAITKKELAQRMNRPASKLSAIFSGDKAITPETALQLENVVGVPAHIWTGLEDEYRLTLARQEEALKIQQLKNESSLLKKFCYAELVKLGKIAKKTKPIEKVRELQRYFGVTSLYSITTLKRYQAAFRYSGTKQRKPSPEAIAAWLRMGELEGQRNEGNPFNKMDLMSKLDTLRRMTTKSPEEFESRLREVLLESGVVLILVPHLQGTYVHGATFWLGNNKAILMLTIRGKWADIFWFSLFHEIGHLLLHSKQDIFLEGDLKDEQSDRLEKESDKFAGDILIPLDRYRSFLKGNSLYPKDIVEFANNLGVHPGIIVGRLQHDNKIEKSWYNGLRSQYKWRSK